MKGIVLAGGTGSRMYPLTLATSKQLLPVYSKPMVYYPLSVLMLAGIQDVLIVTTGRDASAFQALLGDGSRFGVSLSFAVQDAPGGLAQAFLVGEQFLGGEGGGLVLGDNVFYGQNFTAMLHEAAERDSGATVFACPVESPSAYGVIELDDGGRPIGIEEKPADPRSDLAVTGLYFYDRTVVDRAKSLRPSARGELEITDLNRSYLEDGRLWVTQLGRGFAWLDTGSYETLLQASNFVAAIESRQGHMIACLEEIAYRSGWIDDSELSRAAAAHRGTPYGRYLLSLLAEAGGPPQIRVT